MHTVLLALQLHAVATAGVVGSRATQLVQRARAGRERGQSTAEYALVLLGAATVAVVFLAWAGKTSRIGKLFDAVLDTVIGKV
jgi:hypothetical protein